MAKGENKKMSSITITNKNSIIICAKWIKTMFFISIIVALCSIVLYQTFTILKQESAINNVSAGSNTSVKDAKYVTKNSSINYDSVNLGFGEFLNQAKNEHTASVNNHTYNDSGHVVYPTIPFVACEWRKYRHLIHSEILDKVFVFYKTLTFFEPLIFSYVEDSHQ